MPLPIARPLRDPQLLSTLPPPTPRTFCGGVCSCPLLSLSRQVFGDVMARQSRTLAGVGPEWPRPDCTRLLPGAQCVACGHLDTVGTTGLSSAKRWTFTSPISQMRRLGLCSHRAPDSVRGAPAHRGGPPAKAASLGSAAAPTLPGSVAQGLWSSEFLLLGWGGAS